jgi:hypothetical protein
MRKFGLVTCVAALSLTACVTAAPPAANTSGTMSPRDAIVAAADAAPRGVSGIFELAVQATDRDRGRVFLNSETDYRDQRNLTVVISPAAAKALEQHYGRPPEHFFKGRAIRVNGSAMRVRIDFIADGRPTGKYYYQTHVQVTDAAQIRVSAQ